MANNCYTGKGRFKYTVSDFDTGSDDKLEVKYY